MRVLAAVGYLLVLLGGTFSVAAAITWHPDSSLIIPIECFSQAVEIEFSWNITSGLGNLTSGVLFGDACDSESAYDTSYLNEPDFYISSRPTYQGRIIVPTDSSSHLCWMVRNDCRTASPTCTDLALNLQMSFNCGVARPSTSSTSEVKAWLVVLLPASVTFLILGAIINQCCCKKQAKTGVVSAISSSAAISAPTKKRADMHSAPMTYTPLETGGPQSVVASPPPLDGNGSHTATSVRADVSVTSTM